MTQQTVPSWSDKACCVCRGELWLDAGAVTAIKDKHKSLFAAGIVKIVGDFHAQDGVRICDQNGFEVARGLPNYDAEEIAKIAGKDSSVSPGGEWPRSRSTWHPWTERGGRCMHLARPCRALALAHTCIGNTAAA